MRLLAWVGLKCGSERRRRRTRRVGWKHQGADLELQQRQFLQTQGPVARREFRTPLRFCAPEGFCPLQGVTLVIGVRGKATMSTKCSSGAVPGGVLPNPSLLPAKPSEAGSPGKGGTRERAQFSPPGGNGAERTLRRRQWGAHPAWTMPPAGADTPVPTSGGPSNPIVWKFQTQPRQPQNREEIRS